MPFDFRAYTTVPRGFKIVRNDDELWIKQISTNRVYRISSPQRGEFELFYTSDTSKDPEFVMRSDSLYHLLRATGLLTPQPSMHKQTQLTIRRSCGK